MLSVGIFYTVINTVDFVGMCRYRMGRLGIKGKPLAPEDQGLRDLLGWCGTLIWWRRGHSHSAVKLLIYNNFIISIFKYTVINTVK